MLAHFAYKTWAPPEWSLSQSAAIKELIRVHGRALLTLSFIRIPTPGVLRAGVTSGQVVEYWALFFVYLLFICAGGAAIAWAQSSGGRSAERVGSVLLAVGVLGSVMFLLSVAIVGVRHYLWLLGFNPASESAR